MKDNIICEKSFEFAIKIVNVYKNIIEAKKEFVLSNQMLKSGTSIGANVREAIEAQSTKDFISKMCIALKEASETDYWLALLERTGYIDKSEAQELRKELNEIIKILNAIIKTTKDRLA